MIGLAYKREAYQMPWFTRERPFIQDTDIYCILFVGRSEGHWLLTPYYQLLRWRWRNRYFKHYWEGALKKGLIHSPLKPVLAWLTRKLVKFNPITHKGAV